MTACLDVARAAPLDPGGVSGDEHYFRCPRHDDRNPSLKVNVEKNNWMCGPCGASGNWWALAAWCGGGLDPEDKEAVKEWLRSHGLTNGNGSKPAGRIVAEYRYEDEGGKHLYDVVRMEPKTFRQRAADGSWSMADVRRVLYRLPELAAASEVFIVEGEKDVDALRAYGFTATCNPGGAGKWRPEYSESLRGKHVTIIPDNDEPGREHARRVAGSLEGAAASVSVLELPGLPPKGDVSDWLEGQGLDDAMGELARLAEQAAERSPDAEDLATPLTVDAMPVDELLTYLATLSPFEYERRRQYAAERLKVRVSAIDVEIAARRKLNAGSTASGQDWSAPLKLDRSHQRLSLGGSARFRLTNCSNSTGGR